VSIDGPAVFEENESTFIVGPDATRDCFCRRVHPRGGNLMAAAPSMPIELELLWRRLISLVDEAAAAMVRTIVLDPGARELRLSPASSPMQSGQSLVQASAESIPSFIGTCPRR
jgi:hypothetical protein